MTLVNALPKFYSLNFNSANYPDPVAWDSTQKIAVFLDRVEGWQIGIADLLSITIPSSGWPVLRILFSYFEMIAKYRDGFTEKGRSAEYFTKGVAWVFEGEDFFSNKVTSLAEVIYEDGRCSLYHGCSLGKKILLKYDLRVPLCENYEGDGIVINPKLFSQFIRRNLFSYVDELRRQSSGTGGLWLTNFEKRFNWESGI